MTQQFKPCVGQRIDVALRNQPAGFTVDRHLRDIGMIGGQHRNAARLCLEHYGRRAPLCISIGCGNARLNQQMRLGQLIPEYLMWLIPQLAHKRRKIVFRDSPVGMGEAYTAVSNDAASLYWNPTGLTRFSGTHIAVMHNTWVQGVNYESVGVAYGDSASSGFGVGLTFLWMDDIPVTTFGDRLGSSGDTFTARDFSFVVSYAHQILPGTSLGGSFKRIRSTLADVTATATAFDVGVIVTPSVPGLAFGAAVQNAGSKLKFVRDGDRLPLIARVGVAYTYRNTGLVSVEVAKPVDNRARIHAGGEFVVRNALSLRAGYRSSQDTDNGFTGGAGVRIRRMSIDYALSLMVSSAIRIVFPPHTVSKNAPTVRFPKIFYPLYFCMESASVCIVEI